jgi:hypothetical protein
MIFQKIWILPFQKLSPVLKEKKSFWSQSDFLKKSISAENDV